MKKIFVLFVLVTIIAMTCGCSLNKNEGGTENKTETSTETTTESTTEDFFENYDYFYERTYYHGHFDDYFTPEEFMELSLMLKEKSFEPQMNINKEYLIVRTGGEFVDTTFVYDYLIVNVNGDVIRNYGNSGWVAEEPLKIGDFYFIKLQGVPSKYELIDKNAEVVSIVESNSRDHAMSLRYFRDLGDRYHLFYTASKGQFWVYILHPNGEYYFIPMIKRAFLGYSDFSQSFENGDAEIGRISNDLYYFTFILGKSKQTWYFNSLGEPVEYEPNT